MIDQDELLEAVQDSMFGDGSMGWCLACENSQEGCEPDAREYVCESCGEEKVYGAQELLMMGYAS